MQQAPDTQAPGWYEARWALFLVLLLSALAYLPTLGSYYLADDFKLFSLPMGHGQESWLLSHAGYVRPLARLSLRVDYLLWGLETHPAHAVNMLLHLGTTSLLMALTARISRSWVAPFAAGLLFGLHPIHPGAVSWLSSRFDLLCAVFVLASLLLYDSYRRSPGPRALVCSVLLFAAALLSKELAVCLPVLLVGLDLAQRRPAIKPLLPYALLLVLYLGLRFYLLGSLDGTTAFDGGSQHLKTTPGGFLTGLLFQSTRAFVLPVNDLVWGVLTQPLQLLIGGLVLAVLLVALVDRRARGAGAILFGAALWIVATLPVASVIESGFGAGFVDSRMAYLPSAGFCIVLAELIGRLRRASQAIALVLIGLVYSGTTVGNNLAWREAGEISAALPERVVELWPSFDVEEPILVVQDLPDVHRGAYVFLTGSVEKSIEIAHPEPPRVIAVSNRSKKRKIDLRALDPARVFALRWEPTDGQLHDVTQNLRASIAAHRAEPFEPQTWNWSVLPKWLADGRKPSEPPEPRALDERTLYFRPAKAQVILESPPLPRGTGFVMAQVARLPGDDGSFGEGELWLSWSARAGDWSWRDRVIQPLKGEAEFVRYRVATPLTRIEDLETEHVYVRIEIRSPGAGFEVKKVHALPVRQED